MESPWIALLIPRRRKSVNGASLRYAELVWGSRRVLIVLTLGFLVPTGFAQAPPPRSIAVAAASDLRFALDEIVSEFSKANPGIDVRVSYGSSGNFFSQIANGAPFDIFFSADLDYVTKLGEQGLTLEDSHFVYGIGRIVLWTTNASKLDLSRGLAVLLDPSVRKIAIANPRHAPYGRAAEAALRSAKIYDAVQPKLVFGDNVAQTAQFAQTGAADAGIVAHALALAPTLQKEGRSFLIPSDQHPKLEQGGAILRRTEDAASAQAFSSFVLGPRGGAILDRYGFEQSVR
jgi:molybdate transport system substrate-binding protein